MLLIDSYIFGKCPRSVNNFRTNYFYDLGGFLGIACLPPSPASMPKFPSGGKFIERNVFKYVLMSFMKIVGKMKMVLK